ncbi:hypothetical protein SUGI_1037130 [Cryptomeria japonica]|nr:hypothetical protein SUGI_1037130 [Cryptomeria japonica]
MGSRGESIVVAMVITRVVSVVPRLLSWECGGLLSLCAAALFVQLKAEHAAHQFKIQRLNPRPGSSSGIFLGAVTLPTVMLSRLIQLQRSLLAYGSESPALETLRLCFWASCACSLGVLSFLVFVLWYSREGGNHHSSAKRMQVSAIGIAFMVAFGIQCSFSLMGNTESGLFISMGMVWLLLHALMSGIVLQYIIHKFPSCSSIGETLLVTSGLVLYLSDVLACILSKVKMYAPLSNQFVGGLNVKGDEIGMIVQAFLGSLLLMSVTYNSFLHIWICCIKLIKALASRNDERTSEKFQTSIMFYVALGITLIGLTPQWLYYIKDFETHPLLWVIDFILEKPMERLAVCIYWLAVICVSVLRFYNISKDSKIERILLRKYYHLLAVIMFVPALLFDADFLKLAFGAALAMFLILEMIRVWQILPLGDLVNQFMNAFTDHRDSEIIIISHFSLLLGCAIPIWMSAHFNDRPLAPFAGILSLGIGDTMASMVGHKYGVLRWSKSGKKTIEGTAAGITSVLFACLVLIPWLTWTSFSSSQDWLSLLIAVIFAVFSVYKNFIILTVRDNHQCNLEEFI